MVDRLEATPKPSEVFSFYTHPENISWAHQYSIGGSVLERVSEVRDLGVT